MSTSRDETASIQKPKRKVQKPSFEMTAKERKVWKDGLKACIAADPQRALKDWSRRNKVKLTNEAVVTVTRTVTNGRFSPNFVELANVGHTRTTVNGVVSPLGQNVAPGAPVEAKKCQGHCEDEFTVNDKPLDEALNITCKFKRCYSKIIGGQKMIVCQYTCTGTASTLKPA